MTAFKVSPREGSISSDQQAKFISDYMEAQAYLKFGFYLHPARTSSTLYQPGLSKPGPSIPSGSLNLPNNNQYSGGSPSGTHATPSTSKDPRSVFPQPNNTYTKDWKPPSIPADVQLTPADYQKAMKYCKYASSALQYEDSKTAIDNLTKALKLLSIGKDT